ncbi:hypothetical protein LCGC14_0359380 [marine sediment metagenome]|uniref:Uncharacterized protein n=1 Tax=marine sediment metagenome TaxID=412755 RepID=A0A0F9WGM8_9ZZZZ
MTHILYQVIIVNGIIQYIPIMANDDINLLIKAAKIDLERNPQ